MAIFEIFRQPPEEHLHVQSRIDAINTFFNCKYLSIDAPKKNKRSITAFLGENCLGINGFLAQLYSEDYIHFVIFSKNLHKDDKRKVTKDPYFKHLFYTAYLCHEIAKKYNYTDNQKKIMIAAAFFHDTIELKKKNHLSIVKNTLVNMLLQCQIDIADASDIANIDSFLTPSERDNSQYPSKTWIGRKRKNFSQIMDKLPSLRLTQKLVDIMKQIKIADEAANIRETVVDVKADKDGPDKEIHNHKSFADRIAVFEERVKIIAERFPDHILLPQLIKDCSFLKGCLSSN